MNVLIAWWVVLLAFLVVITHRRALALAAVSLQSLIIVAAAGSFPSAHSGDTFFPALVLALRSALVIVILFMSVRQVRPSEWELRTLISARRCTLALAVSIAIFVVTPDLGFRPATINPAVMSVIALGILSAAVHRSTLVQIMGILVIENGVAVAALSTPHGIPLVFELGLVLDIVIVVAVAAVLHARIVNEFGSGDVHLLRMLRER